MVRYVWWGIVLSFLHLNFVTRVHSLEPKCRGQAVKLSDEQLGGIMSCMKSAGLASPENMPKEKLGCFSKCMMEKYKLVDAEGKPHKENILNSIDANLPNDIKEEVKTKVTACLDLHGSKINPTEKTCESYIPLAVCNAAGIKEICKA